MVFLKMRFSRAGVKVTTKLPMKKSQCLSCFPKDTRLLKVLSDRTLGQDVCGASIVPIFGYVYNQNLRPVLEEAVSFWGG